MAIVDEETRRLILKKTWCHGQAVLPFWSIVILVWWWNLDNNPFQLVLAAIVFPPWSVYSYNTVIALDEGNGALPYPNICSFGILAMLAHLLIFLVAIQDLADTVHMLLTVASGLFFMETGAFLLVVTACRNEIAPQLSTRPLNPYGNEEHYSS
jgi:hypothetical protein